jgi:hypothetical protein
MKSSNPSVDLSPEVYSIVKENCKALEITPTDFIENCVHLYLLKEASSLNLLLRRVKVIGDSPMNSIQLINLSMLYSYLSSISHRLSR